MASKEVHRIVVDADGVRTVYDPRAKWILVGTVAASAVVVAVATMAIFTLGPRSGGSPPAQQRTDAVDTPVAPPAETAKSQVAAPSRARTDVRAVHVDRAAPSVIEPEDRKTDAQPTEQPELLARDVIPALVAAGEKEGIAAFPPPGTDPPKSGILVPEDYELPPGYVRHYQVTDDGKRLGAILMFSPDFEFVDQSGRPVPVPEHRIVPPEMAPPGLPIRMLEIPKNELGLDRGGR